jgi:hypothetical protein
MTMIKNVLDQTTRKPFETIHVRNWTTMDENQKQKYKYLPEV